MKTLMEKAVGQIEAASEWSEFTVAIQRPQPALQTFTNEALMLIYLMLGNKALRTLQEKE